MTTLVAVSWLLMSCWLLASRRFVAGPASAVVFVWAPVALLLVVTWQTVAIMLVLLGGMWATDPHRHAPMRLSLSDIAHGRRTHRSPR